MTVVVVVEFALPFLLPAHFVKRHTNSAYWTKPKGWEMEAVVVKESDVRAQLVSIEKLNVNWTTQLKAPRTQYTNPKQYTERKMERLGMVAKYMWICVLYM